MKEKKEKLLSLLEKEIRLYRTYPESFWSPSQNVDQYINDLKDMQSKEFGENEIDEEIALCEESISSINLYLKTI